MNNFLYRWRVAIRLARVISRSTKLAAVERRKPRDDRRSFIVLCDDAGHFHVFYYETQEDYVRGYDEVREQFSDAAWIAGYDKWSDQRG